MIIKAFSIYDRKALSYGPPFFAATDGAAIRSLTDLVGDPNTTVGRHPGDFVLYCIGSYDDSKGLMEALSPCLHVVDAVALVPPQQDLFKRRDYFASARDQDAPPRAGNLSNGKEL